MARFFHQRGWCALAWNFRGCSEEINRNIGFYHSGATDDLKTVIGHINNAYHFTKLYLIGFSLGGNLILKYLGESGSDLPDNITRVICFSVPLDLHQSCLKLSKGFNRVYSQRFLRMLKEKVYRKSTYYPGYFDLKALYRVKGLMEFDDMITAPIHGFKNAIDYYHQCSSLNFLDRIVTPTLIVNAKNDPFLSESCFPVRALDGHPSVEILIPEQGGHCGFADRNQLNGYWSEILAWNYFNHC